MVDFRVVGGLYRANGVMTLKSGSTIALRKEVSVFCCGDIIRTYPTEPSLRDAVDRRKQHCQQVLHSKV